MFEEGMFYLISEGNSIPKEATSNFASFLYPEVLALNEIKTVGKCIQNDKRLNAYSKCSRLHDCPHITKS